MKQNRLLSNMGWMVGGKVFQMFFSLFIGMFTARLLGPKNYGVIGYVTSYVAFFSSLCTLGLNGIIVKEFVKYPEKQGELLYSAIVLRIVSSFLSIIAIMGIMIVTHGKDRTILGIAFLLSISLLFGAFDIINYWYQSKLLSKIPVILTSTAYLIVAIYKIIILVLQKEVIWFAFATTLDMVLIAVFLMISYFRYQGQKLKFSVSTAKSLLQQSYHFILSGVMVAVFAQTDKIMIGQMLNTTEVGLYSVAITICGLWSFIPAAIIDSVRPVIMEAKGKDESIYNKRMKQLYAAIIWMSIFYGIFISVFARWIVIILYGKQYLGAIGPLRIAVWYCAFSYLGAAKNIWLISENKQKYEKWFTLAGAVVNVGLNMMFIPILGIKGAAIATLVTQIITNFVLPSIPSATRKCSKDMIEALLLREVGSVEYIRDVLKKIREKKHVYK